MGRNSLTMMDVLVGVAVVASVCIILPSLSAKAQQGRVIICLSNQKHLAAAFIAYANDNDDQFCSGYVLPDLQARTPPSWVIPPLQYGPSGQQVYVGHGDSTGLLLNNEARRNGIREGAIYPYLDTTEVYHCPGDDRITSAQNGNWGPNVPSRYYQAFRSYGMPDFYTVYGGVSARPPEKYLSRVQARGQKMLFVEQRYDNAYYNIDAWSYIPGDHALWDPLGNYHQASCTFSFVDGHVAMHKWQDERTIIFMNDRALAASMGFGKGDVQIGNVDLDWLDAHYPSDTRF